MAGEINEVSIAIGKLEGKVESLTAAMSAAETSRGQMHEKINTVGAPQTGDTATAWYSTDGIHWTSSTLPSTHHWIQAFWSQGQGVFLMTIAGEDTNVVATSPDCITWTSHTLPSDFSSAQQNGGGTDGNDLIVLGRSGGDTNYVAKSSDGGSTWSQATLPLTCLLVSPIGWNGKIWFAACYDSVANPPLGMTSPDGLTWTSVNLPYVSGQAWLSIITAPNPYLQN